MKDNSFNHFQDIQIRFNDIDILGHVNNSIYQNYFDLARTGYFNNIFKKKVDWKNNNLVLAKITIEYFAPVFMEESIAVFSKVYEFGNKSLKMQQELVNIKTLEVKARNDAVLVAFNYQLNQSIEMPADWKENIVSFEKL